LDAETSQFINRLVSHVKNERVFESVTELWEKKREEYKGRWDTPARKIFGPVLKEVFRQSFPNEDDKTSIYVEGEGTPKLWEKPHRLFGSAGVYPDLAILKPRKIAIELDHSKRGSGLKMALAKASFNVLSGSWENCFVLFYNRDGKLSLDGKKEKEICKIYEEQFHTRIFLFSHGNQDKLEVQK
jgi:hypothetical protein